MNQHLSTQDAASDAVVIKENATLPSDQHKLIVNPPRSDLPSMKLAGLISGMHTLTGQHRTGMHKLVKTNSHNMQPDYSFAVY